VATRGGSRRASGPLLTRRVLNRSYLARQSLLERVARPPLEVVAQLVGLQAQEPIDPYVGLWSRIADFDATTLSDALAERRAVRIGLMRTTLHLVTTDDALALSPVMDDVLRRTFRSTSFHKALAGVDAAAVIEAARKALAAEPMTPSDLGRRLAVRWPDRDPQSLSLLARYHLPLVQVPPRGLWRQTGRARNTTLDAWTGREAEAIELEELVRRYLRAFGPATVGDMRTWSWLTGLREVVERLRPTLRTYADERGRELFDVEDGLIVGDDVPAPIRFLPQYDNLFLSHEDRSRISGDHVVGLDFAWKGSILVDGAISATWRHRADRKTGGTITIEVGPSVTADQRDEVMAEAGRLAAFLDPEHPPSVIVVGK
jgi:hypothetical protein